ncbi:MAG: AAA-like domain-containing protein [Pelatocladus maniniholoensis HA4357-MV3]|jgi:DNA-binding Xre family transcriptional regulator|uniref:AAA-like domain-containing protein n=1 Tax=Pelatocladus maniniholoensis HA4357-MV3 TaxID=1117104 RepID=A0A9E3LS34_9NOST|nr:AAA-like domain-containing protein [Pelatocladus maniniholoensis HA4357-MV3]BAZ65382.1 hypothetical protein NIES4106_01200 [Fischerella sp. NIES-4106]
MSRSVKIRKECIDKVKTTVQLQGYPRQKDLAEDVGVCLDTVRKFLNGKPIDCLNFQEICQKLGLDWQAIADFNPNINNITLPEFADEPDTENFIYVKRPYTESICEQTLRQAGALLLIKAPGLMGKTSLMAKILLQLASEGYRTVFLNLHYAEIDHFTNLDKFLQWFSVSVGKRLKMSNQLANYWDDESSSKLNCTAYFEEYLLPQSLSPLVLCLDEVERIFPYQQVASEFFGLLRVWHELAKTCSIWQKMRLIVVHSTEVYVPLNVNESPFNVGKLVQLPELTPEQVNDLAQQYGIFWEHEQIQQLMSMLRGHPYLLGQAFSYLKNNTTISLEEFLQSAPTEAGIYSSFLRRYWKIIQQHFELAEALKKVVITRDKIQLEPMLAYKLYSMGLIHLTGNEVEISCNLYRLYFGDRFGINS